MTCNEIRERARERGTCLNHNIGEASLIVTVKQPRILSQAMMPVEEEVGVAARRWHGVTVGSLEVGLH